MITLVGQKEAKDFKQLQEKLDSLSVSYRIQYRAVTSYILDGQIEIKGDEKIEKYLIELEQDLDHWYYCI